MTREEILHKRWERAISSYLDEQKIKILINYLEQRRDGKKAGKMLKYLKKLLTGRLTHKKEKVLKDFYLSSQDFNFSPYFLIVNNKNISPKSYERLLSLSIQGHNKDAVPQIVESMPSVLSCSLERTKSIYSLLSEQGHDSEAVLKIIKSTPSVLGCSLERTKSIYNLLSEQGHDSEAVLKMIESMPSILGYSLERTRNVYGQLKLKVEDAPGYIEQFPLLLYFSPKFIAKSTPENILKILFEIEERRYKKNSKEIPINGKYRDTNLEYNSGDMKAFHKWEDENRE